MSSSSSDCYTPFECFPIALQTASGLLELSRNEVSILHRAGLQLRSGMEDESMMVPVKADGTVDVELSNRQYKDRCEDLLLQLTTHRTVFWKEQQQQSQSTSPTSSSSSSRQGRYLSHSFVLALSAETEWFKSPKILINTVMGDILLVFTNSQQRDDLLESMQKTIKRKEWENDDGVDDYKQQSHQLSSSSRKAKAMTSHKVGVDAIMSKNKIKHLQAQQLTNKAMAAQDAETLMKEATELVAIIHKYVATLERQELSSSSSSSSNNEEDPAATKKLVSMLQDMGMTSALSKTDFVGQLDSYYEQLARQIADVIRPKLRLAGGVLALTDVYVAFNRARASNLLSPEDLHQAVMAMDKPNNGINVGMRTKTFPSGLIVLQLDELQDSSNILKDAAAGASTSGDRNHHHHHQQQQQRGINELEAARLLNTSALLAHEQLLEAERVGKLVRDECLEMMRFYPNRFDEWVNDELVVLVDQF